jgi:lipoprotein-anchoring transpeptidase ErfK/SrfK
VLLPEQPATAFAFVLTWLQPSLSPDGPANDAVPALARYDVVTIFETRQAGDVSWYRTGENQWIPQKAVGVVTVDPRPEGVGPDERWIEVDLFEQTLAAYDGGRMVYATLVSTGLKQWATDPGLFRIWAKLERFKMSGRDGLPDYYYLEDVPWIMYFNNDTALHGAYWHDRFGYPHSHGCVNLAPLDAKWLFDFVAPAYHEGAKVVYPTEADPGTWVWVHE